LPITGNNISPNQRTKTATCIVYHCALDISATLRSYWIHAILIGLYNTAKLTTNKTV